MLENSRYIVSFQKTCQYLDDRIVEIIRAEGGAGINRVPNQPLTVQKMTPPAAKRPPSTGSSAAANTQAKQMAPPAARGVRSSSTGSSAAATATSVQPRPPAAGPRPLPTRPVARPQPQAMSTLITTRADNTWVRF